MNPRYSAARPSRDEAGLDPPDAGSADGYAVAHRGSELDHAAVAVEPDAVDAGDIDDMAAMDPDEKRADRAGCSITPIDSEQKWDVVPSKTWV